MVQFCILHKPRNWLRYCQGPLNPGPGTMYPLNPLSTALSICYYYLGKYCTYKTHLKRLKFLQSKVVEIIAGGQFLDDSKVYYKQLNIFKIEDLYTLEGAKLMHKFSQNKLPNRLSSCSTPINAINTRTTRLAFSNLNLYIPLYRTIKMQRFFKFQGVSI